MQDPVCSPWLSQRSVADLTSSRKEPAGATLAKMHCHDSLSLVLLFRWPLALTLQPAESLQAATE
jgi:hypothetical protein